MGGVTCDFCLMLSVHLLSGRGRILVFDHLFGLVGDRLVDRLESFLSREQVVFHEEHSSFFAEAIELPGIALSPLIVVQSDFFHDPRFDQLL